MSPARPPEKINGARPATRAALGLRAHSGWAALVVVAGSPNSPLVLGRRRVELTDAASPQAKQPYHAAQKLDLKEAEQLISRSTQATNLLALRSVRSSIEEIKAKGYTVAGVGVLFASGRAAATLAQTLASHALIHTAEGELFRKALVQASEKCGLPVTKVKERELLARCVSQFGMSEEKLHRHTSELKRILGPPWRQDERYATLVALLALAQSPPSPL